MDSWRADPASRSATPRVWRLGRVDPIRAVVNAAPTARLAAGSTSAGPITGVPFIRYGLFGVPIPGTRWPVDETRGITLDATTSSDPAGAADPLTYAWDFDGIDQNSDNNLFDDAFGATPSVTAAQIRGWVGNPTPSSSKTWTPRVRVDDGDGGQSIASFTYTIQDVRPSALIWQESTTRPEGAAT